MNALRSLLNVGFASILIATAFSEPAPTAPKVEPPKAFIECSDTEAAQHIGEMAVVKGKVVAVGASKQGNVYLNFGGTYPKQTFSGIVRVSDVEKVGDTKKYEGKVVTITGKVESYNDKPQIAIASADQLKLVEAPPTEPVKP